MREQAGGGDEAGEQADAKRRKVPDVEKTSLKAYVDGFEGGFLKSLYASIRADNREAAQQAAAQTGDW